MKGIFRGILEILCLIVLQIKYNCFEDHAIQHVIDIDCMILCNLTKYTVDILIPVSTLKTSQLRISSL